MFGPLGEYEDKEYYEKKRFCNFDSGEELDELIDELGFVREEELTNVYISDFSGRWSTRNLSFQRCNIVLLEYQMNENRTRQVVDYLVHNDFQREFCPGKKDHETFFGDFQFYYRVESNNLQTLVAVNPIDNRLRITCFHYNLAHHKFGNEYAFLFSELNNRITATPSAESNLYNHILYATREIWTTKGRR